MHIISPVMTDEEFDKLWEESGKRQRELEAMWKLERSQEDSAEESPMLRRWRDGSDIVDNDDEEDDSPLMIPDDMPLDDIKVLAVNAVMRRGLTKAEALAKYQLSESYYDENEERVSNS